MWVVYLIIIYAFVSWIVLSMMGCFDYGVDFSFLNPFVMSENVKLNTFDTVLLCILVNILFAPYAVCYWLYKTYIVWRNTYERRK